jgi:hypothetical protein
MPPEQVITSQSLATFSLAECVQIMLGRTIEVRFYVESLLKE